MPQMRLTFGLHLLPTGGTPVYRVGILATLLSRSSPFGFADSLTATDALTYHPKDLLEIFNVSIHHIASIV